MTTFPDLYVSKKLDIGVSEEVVHLLWCHSLDIKEVNRII